jgi:hypothetical protein
MDPFLEDPIVFPDFHDRFIAYLSELLQPRLPEPYYAALGKRAWVTQVARGESREASCEKLEASYSGRATIEVSQPVVIHVPLDEQSESLVEIYIGRGGERRLVTAIELLSPANKKPGEKGRDLYLRKQAELLDSKTHLVEIDLELWESCDECCV